MLTVELLFLLRLALLGVVIFVSFCMAVGVGIVKGEIDEDWLEDIFDL